MSKFSTLSAMAVAAFFGTACVSTSAAAGEWRFDAARCPDLVEDRIDRRESRRDRRVDRGPLDRAEDRRDARESRRDERVTVCPRSAWVWHGAGPRTARPATVNVYYDRVDAVYYRKGRRGRTLVVVR